MTEEESPNWTAAQNAAFCQIEQIMREHFDAGVFRVLAEINDDQDESRGSYSGGKTNALGLLHLQTHELIQKPSED
jgi:hypothetical protein